MNLIHFRGLNCYHDCVISIANHFGLNYPAAFATLWSETDFRYDPYRKAYLTKRMLTNLEALGAKAEGLDCLSPKDKRMDLDLDMEGNLALFGEGEFMIVGMDAFYIPWNQFYRTFHGPHYLIVQNAQTKILFCNDPTYNKKNEQLARQEIIAHTFDLIRIKKVSAKYLQSEPIYEAQEILRTHPNTFQTLLSRIYGCVNGDRESIVLLAKYIDAMICNRYLYRFFLKNQLPPCDKNHLFLNSDFFSKWNAVKNGLYKASVCSGNKSIINEVCDYFKHLLEDEIAMAEKIICK